MEKQEQVASKKHDRMAARTNLKVFLMPKISCREKYLRLDTRYYLCAAERSRYFSESLEYCKLLTALEISINNITSDECKILGTALKRNQSITSLSLESCGMDAEGCSQLCSALKTNQSLTFLNLAFNNLDSFGGDQICELLKINQHLTAIDITDNIDIDYETIHNITQQVESNKIKKRRMIATQLTALQVMLLPLQRGIVSLLPREIIQLIAYHIGYPDYVVEFNQLSKIYDYATKREHLSSLTVSQNQIEKKREFFKWILGERVENSCPP